MPVRNDDGVDWQLQRYRDLNLQYLRLRYKSQPHWERNGPRLLEAVQRLEMGSRLLLGERCSLFHTPVSLGITVLCWLGMSSM